MATQNTKQEMKEVFVVDAELEINSAQVSVGEWEHPAKYFGAEIGSRQVIVLRGGWNKVTTYGGFESLQEAEKFRTALKDAEARKVRAMRKVINILRLQQKNITHQMRARYCNQIQMSASCCPPEEFSEVTRLFKNRFFSALSKLGLTYDDFRKAMVEHEKKEREKTRGHFQYTPASYQLYWTMSIVGDDLSGN